MNNQLKTILLLGALSALVVGLGASVAPGSWPIFLVLALAMNLGAYFFSDRIILRSHGAEELSAQQAPELHAMVEELAHRAEIPKPRIYLIREQQPNAFATGRNPEHGVVAVTEGILQLLEPRELKGVLAHELAHIKNRDILVASLAAAGASLISYAAHALSFATWFGGTEDEEGGAGSGLLAALVAPIAATLIQLGISRSREYLADETGARLAGDSAGLARALLKLEGGATALPLAAPAATASLFIVNPLGARVASVSKWFSTHPETAERVERLRALRLGDSYQ